MASPLGHNSPTGNLPQLPPAVSIEVVPCAFKTTYIRLKVMPALATRAEMQAHKEMIFWLLSAHLLRERQKIEGQPMPSAPVSPTFKGQVINLAIILSASMIDDHEVTIDVSVPRITPDCLRQEFDGYFAEMLNRMDSVRPHVKGSSYARRAA
ncbi:hypothetical protein [Kerstersia similis]|uniref:hypothetical protein n=1 Tax=Kerstersia similis TaxID=206505 RepID=UPI0039EE9210